MTTEAVTTMPDVPAELEKAAAETGLTADGVQSLKAAYAPHFVKFHDLAKSAADILPTAPKAARAMRLELKAVRVAAEKTRKSLKEDSLRRGKAIDGINALLEYQLVPIEEAMEAIEKAEEIAEANRKAALIEARTAELQPYGDTSFYNLGDMPEEQYQQFLATVKAAKKAEAEAAAKAEAERIEAARVAAELAAKRAAEEAAERERMRVENARLAAVAAEERKAREEAERKAQAERAEAERAAAAEREAARREREAIEAKARAEREEAERKAQAERQKREAIEAEQRAAAEAESRRVAAEKAAAKKAAAAPDKKKVEALAAAVRAMALPALASDDGAALAPRIAEHVERFAKWLESEAAKL